MIEQVNLPAVLIAALIASASPGPATLAIAGTAMSGGRRKGLAMASGITTGSWLWSASAALGLGAIMLANAWVFEVVRYVGACYLLYLAFKSAKSALSKSSDLVAAKINSQTLGSCYLHGLGLHITNPKAIFFFGALYSIGVPPGSSTSALVLVLVSVGILSFLVFHGYALLFSSARMIRQYNSLRRWFEGLFALAFGLAGIKVLTSKLS